MSGYQKNRLRIQPFCANVCLFLVLFIPNTICSGHIPMLHKEAWQLAAYIHLSYIHKQAHQQTKRGIKRQHQEITKKLSIKTVKKGK